MSRLLPPYKHILITGASSGLGEALALSYAAAGVHLSLGGRDPARLEAVAGACREKGASVAAKALCVTQKDAVASWVMAADNALPVDIVIANAGISGGTGGVMSGESSAQVRQIFDVNLYGVLNTIEPLLPAMIARGTGHVALVSSLAGFRGWPGAPAYCASKAAVKIYGEGLRGALKRTGVKVHVICPGFVRSRITALNEFHMPLLMDASRAAQIIQIGIIRNKGRIAFPLPMLFFSWLAAALPDSWASALLSRAPAKKPVTKV